MSIWLAKTSAALALIAMIMSAQAFGMPAQSADAMANGVGIIKKTTPQIAGLSPSQVAGGTSSAIVTITGQNFDSRATVQFDAAVFTPGYVNSTQVTLTLSSGYLQSGTHSITVVNSQHVASNTVGFTVSAVSTPIPPTVSAGPNQTITLPSQANLTGTATDNNGLSLSIGWTYVNGPGSVTFGNPGSLTTTASFTTAGTYDLRLTAMDSQSSSSSDTFITVNPAINNPPPPPPPPAATVFYVDPDFAGTSNGSSSAPWRSLDTGAWAVLNANLALGNVTVYFSARQASSDTHQLTTTQIQLWRTDGSANRLTLDGMSQYNANDANPTWSAYSGSSRFTVNYNGWDAITGTTNAPYLASNITIRGFRAFSTEGKPLNLWGGNNMIVEYNEVSHLAFDGDGPGMLLQYSRKAGETEVPCAPNMDHNCGVTNVIIRNNLIHNTQGEGIYIGGVEGQNFPAHSNITIENNTIYDVGQGLTGQGDGIDVKDASSNVIIRGNSIHMTTAKTGDDGIVTMSGGIIERNFIYNMGASGIVLSVTWNLYPSRNGTSVRNNIIVNCGGEPVNNWSHGIVVAGSTAGDQWTNLQIANNTIYGILAASAGDGIGIYLSKYSQSTVYNNLVYNTAAQPFYAETGTSFQHGNNLFYVDAVGAVVAVSGSSSYTSSTYSQFESNGFSANPLFVTTGAPYAPSNFKLQAGSPALQRALPLTSSFSTDYFQTTRGSVWDIGAAQMTQ